MNIIDQFHSGDKRYSHLLNSAQNYLCRRMRMRLMVKLASDVSAITDVSVESEKDIPNEKLTSSSSDSEEIANVDQSVASNGLENYRFLLLPGSLALLTLVGMQVVVCAFWIPQSLTARVRCCRNRCGKNETDDTENPDHHNKCAIHHIGNGNLAIGNCETSPHMGKRPINDLFYPTVNSNALLGLNYLPSTAASVYRAYNTCHYLYGRPDVRHNRCPHAQQPDTTGPTECIIPFKHTSNQEAHKYEITQVMKNEFTESNCCLASNEDLIIPVKCNSPLKDEPGIRPIIRFAH
ncbi:hypothetical protein P879_05504 [Paragonimus westermani]|uniref:Uncharacterized protein n=1 Tax=Paragonimus westermani TaxID=34504 RepID=A0A8T0DV99_9TREM|nr:hypothetical protein P879_05504 [Paragonimus westermani]